LKGAGFARRADQHAPPLVRLAGLMDWGQIERHFASHVTLGRGRPALAPRLVAGLLYRFAPVAAMQRLLSSAMQLPWSAIGQELSSKVWPRTAVSGWMQT